MALALGQDVLTPFQELQKEAVRLEPGEVDRGHALGSQGVSLHSLVFTVCMLCEGWVEGLSLKKEVPFGKTASVVLTKRKVVCEKQMRLQRWKSSDFDVQYEGA